VGPTGQGGRSQILLSQHNNNSWHHHGREQHHQFKTKKNSKGHQISQTKIPFCLVSRTDHESKLRFHRGGLYKEKSEPQL